MDPQSTACQQTDPSRVERVIAARKSAQTTHRSIADNMQSPHAAALIDAPRFWETLAELAAKEVGLIIAKPDHRVVMDEKEAAAFERTLMPFGKYADEPVRDIPPDYLAYITETKFARDLLRYVRSEAFKRRQAAGG